VLLSLALVALGGDTGTLCSLDLEDGTPVPSGDLRSRGSMFASCQAPLAVGGSRSAACCCGRQSWPVTSPRAGGCCSPSLTSQSGPGL